MKQFWIAAAGAFCVVAVVLAVLGKYEGAFVVAAIGCVAWFLGYRARLRETLEDENEPDERTDDEE
jgi:Flp pilus assembly protein TadB